jgi:AmmeMemoRadiSam system protein A
MHFLDPDGRWPILNVSLSYLPLETHAALGREIAGAAADLGRKVAFVASGDCSHRLTHDAPAGYSPQGEELDRTIVSLIDDSDFAGLIEIDPSLSEAGGECGLRSFVTMGGVAEPASAQVLAYEGPFGVGYLTAVVNEAAIGASSSSVSTPDTGAKGGAPGLDASDIVALARETIESYVRDGERPEPRALADPDLPGRAGAFVSLHSRGQLRGCIGTIAPVTDSLAEEVVRNAIQAATSDPRFPPVGTAELGDLDIKVDVLHPPEPAELADLDPATYGVIVTSGARRGLLLPDLDGVDTVEDQVGIAMRKGQIGPGDPIELERFRVDRYA